MLVDGCHTKALGQVGRVFIDLPATDPHRRAGIWRHDPRNGLDQRTLTRTVLTEQCMDFTGVQIETAVLQRQYAGVLLAESAKLKNSIFQSITLVTSSRFLFTVIPWNLGMLECWVKGPLTLFVHV